VRARQRDARVPRDSILGFLVAERLFRSYPAWGQGLLSKARSELVSEPSFAAKARALGLGPLLRLSPGEERSGGRDRDARLADAFEAVVAAVTLDGGLEAAREAVERIFGADVDSLDPDLLALRDFKSALQERAQAEGSACRRTAFSRRADRTTTRSSSTRSSTARSLPSGRPAPDRRKRTPSGPRPRPR